MNGQDDDDFSAEFDDTEMEMDAEADAAQASASVPAAPLAAPGRPKSMSGGGKRKRIMAAVLVLLLAGVGGGGYYYLSMMSDLDVPPPPPQQAAVTPPPQQPETTPPPAEAMADTAAVPGTATDVTADTTADATADTTADATADTTTDTTADTAVAADPFAETPADAAADGLPPPSAEDTAAAVPVDAIAATAQGAAEAATATAEGALAEAVAAGALPDAPGETVPGAEPEAATEAETPKDDVLAFDDGATPPAPAPAVDPAPVEAVAETAAAEAPADAAVGDDDVPGIMPAPAGTAQAVAPAELTDAQPPAFPAEPAAAEAPAAPEAPVAETAAAPEQAAPATQPDAAEKALVDNAQILDKVSTPDIAAAEKDAGISAQEAIVRPLPGRYILVRRDSEAKGLDARLTAARTALASGRHQAALELFSDLERSYPKDSRVLMGRAIALQSLGQQDSALDAYEAVLRQDPKNLEALTNMLGLLKGQDPAFALSRLQELHSTYPASSDIAAQLGIAYGVTGDYAAAIKYLDVADALRPGSATIVFNKAVVYDRMGNGIQAATLYREILARVSAGTLTEQLPLDAIRARLAAIR